MAYLISRRGRGETYPERSLGGGGGGAAFARNFASGPKDDTPTDGGRIQWNAVDAGSPPTPADVPITCAVSGVVLITGTLTLENDTDDPIVSDIIVQVDGVSIPVPVTLATTVQPHSSVVISFMFETTPTDTPIGVTKNIQVRVGGDGTTLLSESSVIAVQEVSVATG